MSHGFKHLTGNQIKAIRRKHGCDHGGKNSWKGHARQLDNQMKSRKNGGGGGQGAHIGNKQGGGINLWPLFIFCGWCVWEIMWFAAFIGKSSRLGDFLVIGKDVVPHFQWFYPHYSFADIASG